MAESALGVVGGEGLVPLVHGKVRARMLHAVCLDMAEGQPHAITRE